MARQFVAVKFRSSDKRTWAYHWDGAPVACGDVVKVPDRSGDGWQRATVHAITDERPAFETKALLGTLEGPGLPPSDLPEPEGPAQLSLVDALLAPR